MASPMRIMQVEHRDLGGDGRGIAAEQKGGTSGRGESGRVRADAFDMAAGKSHHTLVDAVWEYAQLLLADETRKLLVVCTCTGIVRVDEDAVRASASAR